MLGMGTVRSVLHVVATEPLVCSRSRDVESLGGSTIRRCFAWVAAVEGLQSIRIEPPLLETKANYGEEHDRTKLNS